MSESYTEGGDTDADVGFGYVEGQTFHVVEEHTLEWVDLDIKLPSFVTRPAVLLYYADAHHQPWGDCLSRNRGMIYPYNITGVLRRVRFPMQSFQLTPGLYYAIVVRFSPSVLEPPLSWRFDAGDATYPRGLRIRSDDNGETWTPHVGDDHIFVEFGTPPAPPPPPDPPIENVTTIQLGWTNTPDMLKLVTWTSVPCHLFMLWTIVPPGEHLDPLYRRGIHIGDALRTCFVDWSSNEQEEPGDTMYHTFLKPAWPICETRYFTLRGTVAGEWSPSASPIFHYHRKEIPMSGPYYAQINASTWTYWLHYLESGVAYLTARNAPDATSVSASPTRYASQSKWSATRWGVDRFPLYFDTTVIPDDAFIYAAVMWQQIDFVVGRQKDIRLVSAPDLHDLPVLSDYGYVLSRKDEEIATLVTADMTSLQRCHWKINQAGLASIDKTAKTKWALLTIDDVNAAPPTQTMEGIYVYSNPSHLIVAYYLPG